MSQDDKRSGLLPCPFCGSADIDAEFSLVAGPGGSPAAHHEPGCMTCGATAPAHLWNNAPRSAARDIAPDREECHFGLPAPTSSALPQEDDDRDWLNGLRQAAALCVCQACASAIRAHIESHPDAPLGTFACPLCMEDHPHQHDHNEEFVFRLAYRTPDKWTEKDMRMLVGMAMALIKASRSATSPTNGGRRLIYNKATRKIDVVRKADGLVTDSFDPPEELG